MARNAPELPKTGETRRLKKKVREEHDIDEQVEDSFPASDPPSYAGGGHQVGAPKKARPKPDQRHH